MTAQVPESQTLPALLRAVAAAGPDRDALVAGQTRWSYSELVDATDTAARALSSLGVADGDTVALLCPNNATWIPAAIAAMQCGARLDAFNTWVKAYDLDHLLGSSRASVLVLTDTVRSSDVVSELRTLVPELWEAPPGEWRSERFPALRDVLVIGEDVPRGARPWERLLADQPAVDVASEPTQWPGLRPDMAESAAFVMYTSGSTQYPKAVPLLHRDLVVNGFHIGERMGLCGADRIWLGSPLFWSFGGANAMMATFTHGACLVVQEQFSPQETATLLADESVTAAYLLPSIADALADEVAERIRSLDALRTGLMIGRPDELQRVVQELGISGICNVYGSTETYGNCCVTPHDAPLELRLVSQGPPLPGVELRTVDTGTGQTLPAGVPGELQVRGRVMPGYVDDADATAEVITSDGWYRTGDRMLIRDDGAVEFGARLSDMIKTSGINVSPAEVESYLSTHDLIAEVVVVGAPHPSRGEVVVAFVVPASRDLTAEQVRAFCEGKIAGYKTPWVISVVSELPRTGTGKLMRQNLVGRAGELVEQQLGTAAAGERRP